jgi:hypothetical protein
VGAEEETAALKIRHCTLFCSIPGNWPDLGQDWDRHSQLPGITRGMNITLLWRSECRRLTSMIYIEAGRSLWMHAEGSCGREGYPSTKAMRLGLVISLAHRAVLFQVVPR